jgi:Skp family chaperone for outer membrane proteins
MRHRSARLVLVCLCAFVAATLQQAAHAGVISAEQYLNSVDRQQAVARVNAVLARKQVREELERLGVSPDAASERVAALSDQDLRELSDRLEELPAGGSLLGVVGVVFIVLLILEFVGVIDIFKRI